MYPVAAQGCSGGRGRWILSRDPSRSGSRAERCRHAVAASGTRSTPRADARSLAPGARPRSHRSLNDRGPRPVILPDVAKRIRLLGMDVDGVLTDNAVFIANVDGKRVEFKRFDIQDGLGLVVLRNTDIRVLWMSGRE